jgi:TRIAP1/MDM35 family protein
MAHSLSSECTPLKHAYDSCFNAWFAGYLEPTLTPHQQREKDKNPQEYQKQKAEEYQQKCGKVWESYKECVQVSVHARTFGDPSLRLPLPFDRILFTYHGSAAFLESDQG